MLISPEYRSLNQQLHQSSDVYGTSGWKYAKLVERVAAQANTKELLDYGCGKQTLAKALPNFTVHGYDPAIPGLDRPPEPHDVVVCTDVLEHIEPTCLSAVLDDLQRVTRQFLLVQVATRPADKTLTDGRNAHLIIEPYTFWLPLLWSRFLVSSLQLQLVDGIPQGFIAICNALIPSKG